MIDFDHVKEYLPVARNKNKILFAFIKEDMLMGQKLSDKKTVYAAVVMFLAPQQISYRKGILRLAPSKFIALLQPLGYTKEEYVFITETVTEIPEKFEQVLNTDLYTQMQGLPLGVVEVKPKCKGKKHANS